MDLRPTTRRAFSAGTAGVLVGTAMAGAVIGSSHREAPAIAYDPSADNTDVYAFVSPDKPDTVTLIANYTGLQEPGGGPNFYPFNPDVLYWIKVDNTGDGMEDITYSFRFTTDVANPESFLFSGYGPIGDVPSNISQTFTVEHNGEAIGSALDVPPPNIGPRTTPRYNQLARQAIHELDGGEGMVFAGQRDDPFFVDTGAIFDLGGLRPFNAAHLIPLDEQRGQDGLSGFNVNSIALQVPMDRLTSDGQAVEGPEASNAVVGIWAGASRQAPSVDGSDDGEWVQVSRLGNPLINEVIIPLGQKDEWNASGPADDAEYEQYYLNPELAAIINTIYPDLPDARTTERTDLVLILGQGVPTLNQTNTEGLHDMLRLNMGVPPTENPEALGVVAGDLAGFPNGRRLADDVTDIELRAIADGYGAFLAENFELPNLEPNNTVGDGCGNNDRRFENEFPYLAAPHDGYTGGDYRNQPCRAANGGGNGNNQNNN